MTTIQVPAATSATGFVGWIRTPGKRWAKAVECGTQDEAFAALLEHAATVPNVHKDLLVLAAGVHPNDGTAGQLRHRPGRSFLPSATASGAVETTQESLSGP